METTTTTSRILPEWIMPITPLPNRAMPICLKKASASIAYPVAKNFRAIEPQHVSVYEDNEEIVFVISEEQRDKGDANNNSDNSSIKQYRLTGNMVIYLSNKSPVFSDFLDEYAEIVDGSFKSKSKVAIKRATEISSSEKSNSSSSKMDINPPFGPSLIEIPYADVLYGMAPSSMEELVKGLKASLHHCHKAPIVLAPTVEIAFMKIQAQYAKQAEEGNDIIYLGCIDNDEIFGKHVSKKGGGGGEKNAKRPKKSDEKEEKGKEKKDI